MDRKVSARRHATHVVLRIVVLRIGGPVIADQALVGRDSVLDQAFSRQEGTIGVVRIARARAAPKASAHRCAVKIDVVLKRVRLAVRWVAVLTVIDAVRKVVDQTVIDVVPKDVDLRVVETTQVLRVVRWDLALVADQTVIAVVLKVVALKPAALVVVPVGLAQVAVQMVAVPKVAVPAGIVGRRGAMTM